ncbi:MAG: 23S rRNA (adenine(2030)-N(6))-methyltransferase RlmJ [Pseudomonadota bacterium]|nr:23S rRNA (adenine(2030)-N(6))-methyltransferase RlmJ [Pseudomonadota bacterium]
MFSYRHGFHAGNFADVFKHAILVQLVLALRQKDKPFFVLDTHAGAGRYDLHAEAARRTAEAAAGIGRLWGRGAAGPELRAYLDAVAALNPTGGLAWYPGSPRLIRSLLREGDRLAAVEAQAAEYARLKAEFAADPQVAVHCRDGYESLKALLPPRERRGLVFIDPPYDRPGEFQRLLDGLTLLRQRWPGGIVAVWYPILERAPSARFQRQLKDLGIPAVLAAELGLRPYDNSLGMNGCGMIIINPPWRLDATLRRLLPELLEVLQADGQGGTRVEWLSGG